MIEQLNDLRMFMQIASAGSLSEAGRRAGLSLAAVSRRLSGLEAAIGVRLIDRSSRKFNLTEEGRFLHGRAAEILEAVDRTSSDLDALSGQMRGLLRVAAPNQIGRQQISEICASFVAIHREVEIDLLLTDSRPSVLEEDIDLAIQTKRPLAGDIISRRILTSKRVMCASPSYIKANGAPKAPEDLSNHNCIRMRRGLRVYDQWTLTCDGSPREIRVTGTLVSNSGDTIHAWVRSGAGIAVKALWDIEDDLKTGRLVEVLPECACDDIALYVTYSDRRHLQPRVRAFIDFLVEAFQNEMREGR